MRIFWFIFVLSMAFFSCEQKKVNQPIKKAKISYDTALYSLKSIEHLYNRKTFKIRDKSFEAYRNSNTNKVDSIRKVIYLLPFGNMKSEVEAILDSEITYLKAFFQLEIRLMKRIQYDSIKNIQAVKTRMVPEYDYEYYSKVKKGDISNLIEQIEAVSFLNEVVKPLVPSDAVAVLGITEHDIYQPKYNYLFGISGLRDRMGLVSVFRLVDYGPDSRYNIRKVISKQLTNIFSISNVTDYDCVLNFHNSMQELLEGEFSVSPSALEKLKYAIGFDYVKRFEDLAKLWLLENNKREFQLNSDCKQILERVKGKKAK